MLTFMLWTLATLAAIVLFSLLAVLATNNGHRLFRGCSVRMFPPISDEEFIARCKPGTNPEVALKVRAIISEQLAIPANEIYPEHRFIEDLKAD